MTDKVYEVFNVFDAENGEYVVTAEGIGPASYFTGISVNELKAIKQGTSISKNGYEVCYEGQHTF